jgi:hypothetical protein
MKRLTLILTCMSLFMFACSIISTPTQTVPPEPPTATQPPAVTQPPVVTEPPATAEPPTATEPPVAQTNVTCNELSLFLDPSMGSGYNCETIPANTEGMELNPQYTQLTLNGYPLADKFFSPHISVYPVQGFTDVYPDQVPAKVAALQALIGGGSTGTEALPFLPIFNAAQVFHAQYRQLSFQNGSGIRYMTIFAQYYAPVNNHDLFYTFQGLTSDGQYWISAILPINHPSLPDNGDNPPGGMSWEEFGNAYDSYITDTANQLNSQPADSFVPGLNSLDAMIESIQVTP